MARRTWRVFLLALQGISRRRRHGRRRRKPAACSLHSVRSARFLVCTRVYIPYVYPRCVSRCDATVEIYARARARYCPTFDVAARVKRISIARSVTLRKKDRPAFIQRVDSENCWARFSQTTNNLCRLRSLHDAEDIIDSLI